ncbi:MAG: alpha/beta hydrolase, partial [Oscillospiraceae bacterium]|nr:alpha/beta hydrolase [Oscillospiraceae bacterium]
MTKRKKALMITSIILGVLILLMAGIFINHKIRLNSEKELLAPLGKLVEVGGHNMSVYTEGDGEATLVFMSGSGTCSPILDFRSLYSLMSDDYKIVVVEKFGYGFSD